MTFTSCVLILTKDYIVPPQGKIDCLHHCLLYGTVEVVNEFLLHLLKIRKQGGKITVL